MARKYVFELIIEEDNDHFWNNLEGAGVNEVTQAVKSALGNAGWAVDPSWGVTLNLIQYTNKRE